MSEYDELEIGEIKQRIEMLRARKVENSDRLVFLDSPAGKRWIDQKRIQLAAARDRYSKIDVSGTAEGIVRQLIATQNFESYIAADIKVWDEAKKVIEALDRELEQCHSALQKRETAARLSR